MSPQMKIPAACLLAILLTLTAPFARADWRGEMLSTDAGLVVRNPAEPSAAPVAVELEELWRVGGDTDDDDEFFGVICDALVGDAGEIYLLDQQLCEVRVFDADGGFLRVIGREGEGPGEFRRPSSIFFMPTGELGVVQTRPAGIVLLERDGQPGRVFTLPRSDDGGMRRIQEGDCRGGEIVLWGMNFMRNDDGFTRVRSILGVDADGNLTKVYDEVRRTENMARRVTREDDGFRINWALGPDGRVFVNDGFEYRVQVWSPDGTMDRIIEQAYRPRERSRAEIEARENEIRERFNRPGRRHRPGTENMEVEVSPHDRGINWLHVDERSYLWILADRGARDLPEGVLCVLEVYDPDGRFVQEVTLKGEGDIREDRLVMQGDRLFQLTYYESAMNAMRGRESEIEDEEEAFPEPMSVICHRFEWTPPER